MRLGFSRDDVFEALRQNDIFARKYFYPAVNDLACYRDSVENRTPTARDVSQNVLTLPIYEDLEKDDVDRICDVILSLRNERTGG